MNCLAQTAGFLIRRVRQRIPTLLFVSLMLFGLQQLMPGAPALSLAVDERGDPLLLAQIAADLDLERPLHEQYVRGLGNVRRSDLGLFWRIRKPAARVILATLSVTVELGLMALAIACLIGIPARLVAAVKRDRPADWVAKAVTLGALDLGTLPSRA